MTFSLILAEAEFLEHEQLVWLPRLTTCSVLTEIYQLMLGQILKLVYFTQRMIAIH